MNGNRVLHLVFSHTYCNYHQVWLVGSLQTFVFYTLGKEKIPIFDIIWSICQHRVTSCLEMAGNLTFVREQTRSHRSVRCNMT